jgi:hypothetical protein
MIYLIIYLVGCVVALIIAIADEYNGEQYIKIEGYHFVAALLSWLAVLINLSYCIRFFIRNPFYKNK